MPKNHYLSGKICSNMNRTFHSRISASHYIFLMMCTGLALHQLWLKHIIVASVLLLLLVVVIERLIHTTYTITTDGNLLIYHGRFSRCKTIPLKQILAVERVSSVKIWGHFLWHCVVVTYGDKRKLVQLIPVNEQTFVSILHNAIAL